MPPVLVEEVCAAATRTAAKLDSEFPADLTGCRDWNDPALHAALVRFRDHDPDGFGELYDTLQTAAALQMVFAQRELVELAA